MKSTLQKIFGAGVFGTGWTNAGICILLAVGVFLSNELYALLNHGPAVLNLQTPSTPPSRWFPSSSFPTCPSIRLSMQP